MLPGAPAASQWIVSEPRRTLPTRALQRLLQIAVGEYRALDVRPLTEGFRNANFKVVLDGADPVVIRIYEHDRTLCEKEMDVLALVAGSVPVPEVIHAEPAGFDDLPPFAVMRFVDGMNLRELKHAGGKAAIAQSAQSAGEVLAAIGKFQFERSGWIRPGLSIGVPLLHGPDPGPRFVDLCLTSPTFQARVPAELRDRIHAHIWHWAPALAASDDQAQLVHCDFGGRNLLVNNVGGRWSVVAVLDWEFAIAGSPLADIGHFLRYEKEATPRYEPHFSRAYLTAGGALPDDWRHLARTIDMIAGCEALTHDRLSTDMGAEWTELVQATVEDRDSVL